MEYDDDEWEWVPVGTVDEWNVGQGRLISIGARRIGVYRLENSWHGLKDVCPHMGVPLHDGQLVDDHVVCPAHGWRFDLQTGVCPTMDAKVATYAVKVDGQKVLVGI